MKSATDANEPRRSNNSPGEAFPVLGMRDRCMHGKPMPHDCAQEEAARQALRRGLTEEKSD